jgi:uncharacterized tellurite resistance protein B-like protein
MTILTQEQQVHTFDDVMLVLANEERFKIKLGIGSEAFKSLKVGKLVGQLWDMGGAVGTGAGVAASGTVATTFFGTFWTTIGVATAVTPIGWIVGAAVASGGAYYGVSRLFKSYAGSRVDEIPKFLNTGLDVLAATTLDLLGSLALKVAAIDGQIDASERSAMEEYFIEEWGYDPNYVAHALNVLQQNIDKSRLSEMASSLAEFSRQNPDYNFQAMQTELRKLLTEIAEADGHLDEREEMALERIEKALQQHSSLASSTRRFFTDKKKSWLK